MTRAAPEEAARRRRFRALRGSRPSFTRRRLSLTKIAGRVPAVASNLRWFTV